jgi:hypothetical protein
MMGFEGYFKNVNCFTFLKTLAAKEEQSMSGFSRTTERRVSGNPCPKNFGLPSPQ